MAGGKPVGTVARPTTVIPKTTGVGATARPGAVQAGPGGKPIVVRTVPKVGVGDSPIHDGETRAEGAGAHQAEDIFVGGEFQPTGDALVDTQLRILEAQRLAAESDAERPSFFQPTYSMSSADGRGGEFSGAPVFTGTTGLEMSAPTTAADHGVPQSRLGYNRLLYREVEARRRPGWVGDASVVEYEELTTLIDGRATTLEADAAYRQLTVELRALESWRHRVSTDELPEGFDSWTVRDQIVYSRTTGAISDSAVVEQRTAVSPSNEVVQAWVDVFRYPATTSKPHPEIQSGSDALRGKLKIDKDDDAAFRALCFQVLIQVAQFLRSAPGRDIPGYNLPADPSLVALPIQAESDTQLASRFILPNQLEAVTAQAHRRLNEVELAQLQLGAVSQILITGNVMLTNLRRIESGESVDVDEVAQSIHAFRRSVSVAYEANPSDVYPEGGSLKDQREVKQYLTEKIRESRSASPEASLKRVIDEYFGTTPPTALEVEGQVLEGSLADIPWRGARRVYSQGSPYYRRVRMLDVRTGRPVDLPEELQALHRRR